MSAELLKVTTTQGTVLTLTVRESLTTLKPTIAVEATLVVLVAEKERIAPLATSIIVEAFAEENMFRRILGLRSQSRLSVMAYIGLVEARMARARTVLDMTGMIASGNASDDEAQRVGCVEARRVEQPTSPREIGRASMSGGADASKHMLRVQEGRRHSGGEGWN